MKHKTASERMLDYLKRGIKVGTDNSWCRKLGTNQVPDVARKLRNKGYEIISERKRVINNGISTLVVEYSLHQPKAAQELRMSEVVAINQNGQKKLSQMMAERFHVDPKQFVTTVKATCFNGQQVSDEQFMQFLMVANEYKLNPFTKEIYAFPARGGVQPIVSIDGWLNIINSKPEFDGMEFEDHLTDGNLVAVTCRMYRKDRKHPTEVTEYMSECKRNSDTWKNWPARMLRHKATIQAARYAFGFSGIYEPDEIERMADEPKDMGYAQVVNDFINEVQAANIYSLLEETKADKDKFLKHVGAVEIESILADNYGKAISALEAKRGEQ